MYKQGAIIHKGELAVPSFKLVFNAKRSEIIAPLNYCPLIQQSNQMMLALNLDG